MSVKKQFTKYVSQNIAGMVGNSCYILADTFFISVAEGADGITALNLVLPLYSIIFAIGQMIGVGSATRFRILRSRGEDRANAYFYQAVFFALVFSIPFMAAGISMPGKIMSFLGGDVRITGVGAPYTRIFMGFAPFFMWNFIFNAFVRNDGAPTIAMWATLCSSLFNIVMDYVLMFPLGMGMAGAALATAVSPVLGMMICSIHFFSKKNTVKLKIALPSLKYLIKACPLGISAFMGEFASCVTTMVFNMLILKHAGNVGVAAYGVVANVSLVAVSVFNGISLGAQPLFSSFYGKGDKRSAGQVLRLGMGTAAVLAAAIYMVIALSARGVTDIFNSEKNPQLAECAVQGLRLYFTGFLFAGFNIVGTGYLSAVERVRWAFAASLLRGFIAMVLCAAILASLFGMTGIWLAFPAAELITAVVTAIALRQS